MSASPAPAGTSRFLAFLPRFLFEAERPAVYLIKAWLLALLPSLALSAIITALAPTAETPPISVEQPSMLLMVVIGAPFLETLILAAMLLFLNRIGGPRIAAIGSALLWALAHSYAAPTWGLIVWWPFLIMSVALLTWRERGLVPAILIVTAIHALQNGTGALLLLMAG